MDKADLLRELLSDPDVKETLKKILLEEQPKESKPTKRKRTVKKTTKPKTSKVAKKPVKKPVKKKLVRGRPKKTKSKTLDKNDPNYGRSVFVDDLTEAITETLSDGRVVNLIELNKKIPQKTDKKIRPKQSMRTIKCVCGKDFKGMGYLCDSCLRGRNVE